MSPEIVLEFDGGNLRALKPNDIHHGYIAGLNDKQVNRYLAVRHSLQTEQSVAKFISDNQQAKNEVLFGIWQYGEQYHCGSIRLHGIDCIKQTAHMGICIFEKSVWGRGLGSKAIISVTKWAMDNLNVQRIEAGIYEENIASQRAFLKAGYEWITNIQQKYIFDGDPAIIKIYTNCKV
jgi:RimJ/RimL family protein N-acetyltransferase